MLLGMFRPADDAWKSSPGPVASRVKLWLAGLCLAGLALRLVLGLTLPADAAAVERLPDQAEYLELARSLRSQGSLVLVDPRYATEQTLRAYRTPGYPLFVAATNADVRAVRFAQAGADVLTILGTFVLARRFLPAGASLAAAGVTAFNPWSVYFSTLVLSESVFLAVTTWGLACMAWAGASVAEGAGVFGRGWVRASAGMLLLAGSAYVRPVGAVLAIGVTLAGSLLPGRHPFAVHSRWPIPAGMTAVGLVLLVLLPWAARNRVVVGEWVWLTTNDGHTLYDGWNPDNPTGASDQAFVRRMPQLGAMNEVDRATYLKGRAWSAFRHDPGRAAGLAARKVARTWSPVPLGEAGSDWRVRAAAGAWGLPVFALAAWGLLRGNLPAGRTLLLAVPVLVTLVAAGTVGSGRYRMPADPSLAVLAAAGAWAVLAARRRRAGVVPSDGVSDGPGDPG